MKGANVLSTWPWKQQQQQQPLLRQSLTRKSETTPIRVKLVLVVVLLCLCIVVLVFLAYHSIRFHHNHSRSSPESTTDKDRFILFDNDLTGQGQGNVVSGLLAAHLLGQEFNRIVCILPTYTSFLQVFEPIGSDAVHKCPTILEPSLLPRRTRQNQFRLVNYEPPPNECKLKDLLKSDISVLFMIGNTYPRWPTVPDRFFLEHYRAKPVLLDALSYDPLSPPQTVVHLRSPDSSDGHGDQRLGLDETSLLALGDALPKGSDTFLVTNRVAYYQQFTDCCQWSHPPWQGIVHSALGKTWGTLKGATTDSTLLRRPVVAAASQNVQLWADWYTILTSQTVYHTHSDFSRSAIHWMNNKHSYSLAGTNAATGALVTKAESWWIDGETAPLSQRTVDAASTSQLRLCLKYK
jgi:hypothetical protein